MLNIAAVLIFLPFLNHLARLVVKITPDKGVNQQHHLELLGSVADMLPATALLQAEQALHKYKSIVDRHLEMTKEYLFTSGKNEKLFQRIEKYEDITDNMEKEVTVFVCKIMEKTLSEEQSVEAQGIVRIADELESISDYLVRVATYKHRNLDSDTIFEGDSLKVIKGFFEKVEDYYHFTTKDLFDRTDSHFEEAWAKSEQLRKDAQKIRAIHLKRVSEGKHDSLSAMTFSDIIVALRKVRSHSLNIAQAFKNELKEDI